MVQVNAIETIEPNWCYNMLSFICGKWQSCMQTYVLECQ